MNKYLLWMVLLCGVSLNSYAQTYQLAKDGHVGFYIKKFAISVLDAEFKEVNSNIQFDVEHLDRSHMHFVMKVDSLELSSHALHDMVLGPDVFNVAEYKEIIFDSTQIQSLGENKYNVFGNLTIKGKTKPVVFNTTMTSGQVFHLKASTQIQSHNFAMKSKFGSLTDQINIFVDGNLVTQPVN